MTGAGTADRADWIREDVHIHAPVGQIYQRFADPAALGEWLGHHFREYEANGWGSGGCSFRLALPLRTETAQLERDRDDQGAAVSYMRAGEGEIRRLSLGMHAEGRNDVHVTVEAHYTPAGGLLGPVLEPLLFRPHRRQALRESLWNLKQLAERAANGG